jgi:cytochrome c oxidase cbb3-type subunit 3
MMRRLGERCFVALVLVVGLSALAGCERSASGLTEWTPADHDHQSEPRRRTPRSQADVQANPHSAPSQKNQVIEVTWQKQCAVCHGKRGRGDGPQSVMVKAKDLSVIAWQDSVTDEQMRKVIKEGKDKMPAFNLPDSIVDGLVAYVRTLKRKARPGTNEDADEAAEPGAPNAPAGVTAPPSPMPAPGPADTAAQAPTAEPPAKP